VQVAAAGLAGEVAGRGFVEDGLAALDVGVHHSKGDEGDLLVSEAVLDAPGFWGAPYLVLPSASPAQPAGAGIPFGGGTKFLLPLADPLLQFALANPAPSLFVPSLSGTISFLNGAGAVVILVSPIATLHGITITWPGALFGIGGSTPSEARNVLVTELI
jgi:hypothetical protein